MGLRQLFFTFLLLFVLFSGCKKLDPKIEVPSYITINDYTVAYTGIYNNGGPGTTNQKFSDVLVYVGGKAMGTYPIPCNIPVIKEGQADVLIKPVIKTNGVSSVRTDYPFMKFYEVFPTLVKGEKSVITPVFDYYNGINFKWTENFENSGYSIIGNSTIDTSFSRVSSEKFEGNNSLQIRLHPGVSDITVKSSIGYYLPASSTNIYLEINYKASQGFEVGVIGGGSDIRSAGGLNASDTWKKAYMFLTPPVSKPPFYGSYSVYFYMFNNSSGGENWVYIDNIKLISQN